ncbi:MAG: AtpZ/AtpI family protein [Deltaproteobacteria bacterium]|nr:AtpZ/AtpI family protein [Candidatus Zymogenaceae bacterium]
MSEERKKLLMRLLHLSSIGISMALAIVFGLVIGVYLDRWLGTKPWMTLVFLLFGIVAAFRNMFHIARKYGYPEEETDDQANNVRDDSNPGT